jgi:FAD binding domain
VSSDLVVLGLGAAGMAAALRAAELGAKVTVLERQPSDVHTPSLRMSAGMVMVTSGDEATPYLDACAGPLVAQVVNRAWARRAADPPARLAKAAGGLPFTRCAGPEHPGLPGADAVWVEQPGDSADRLDPAGGGGRAVYTALRGAVEAESNIQVQWGARAVRLIREANNGVGGVPVESSDIVRCARVILATGGFEFDEQAKLTYLGSHPTYFYGNPGNVGGGLRMAQAMGADLWHMSVVGGRAVSAFESEDGAMQAFHTRIAPPGYVITDQYGFRYADEESQARQDHTFYNRMLEFEAAHNQYPRIPSYWFFDRRRLSAAPLASTHIGPCAVGLAHWSEDNRDEIERGWIACGDSIFEAAKAAGMEHPGQAEQTISEYNAGCRLGRDFFGRPPASLVPLDSPPYHCVKLWPGGSNTAGGPRRNESAQVLDVYGDPILGLFAAGSLGQAVGAVYPAAGANLSEAFCFGQVAAESSLRRLGRG